MGVAITPLRRAQIGKESAKGTLVAATRQLIGAGRLAEEADYYRSEYPRGVAATVGGAGTVVRRGSLFTWETELSAEDILWPLSTGIKGGISPVQTPESTGLGYVWTHTPEATTGLRTLDSATIEFADSDGSTAHYYGEAGYALTRSLRISAAYNEIARMSWEMFARARQSGSLTSAITPYSDRESLRSNSIAIYLNDTWANLGNTQLTGILRSLTWDCDTGLEADYTMDARSDADMTRHRIESLGATLQLTMELDATAAALVGDWRDNDLAFIRFDATGSEVDDEPVNRGVRVDGCYRWASAPTFADTDGQVLITANLEAVWDTTSTKIFEVTATNSLSAL